MAIVRKRQPLNSGDTLPLNFDFSADLGSNRITNTPVPTVEVLEGPPDNLLTFAEVAVNNTEKDPEDNTLPHKKQGQVVSVDVTAPANSTYMIWKVTMTIGSGRWTYSQATKVVGG